MNQVAETNTRQENRTPVTLKIKFKSETLEQFIERYSIDISHGGIFIRTKEPLSVGRTLHFEFQLKDSTPLIKGDGTVVWTREHDPNRSGVSPGMGVRFDKLPPESQKILERVLLHKGGTAGTAPAPQPEPEDVNDDFIDTPTRVAPAALVDSLMNSESSFGTPNLGGEFADRDMTPLPKPMPFHGEATGVSDETFSESTRVASLDSILAHAKGTEEDDYDEDAIFSSTSGSATTAKLLDAEVDTDIRAKNEYEDPFADLNVAPQAEVTAKIDKEVVTELPAPLSDIPAPVTTKPVSALEAFDLEEAARNQQAATQAELAPEHELAPPLPAPTPAPERRSRPSTAIPFPPPEPVSPQSDTFSQRSAPRSSHPPIVEPHGGTPPLVDTDATANRGPWIVATAAVLLIGGVGGYWFLYKDNAKTNKPETIAAAVDSPPKKAVVSALHVTDPAKEEPKLPVPTSEVLIATVPDGATIGISGPEIPTEGLQGTSPAVFDLATGESFQVVVSHPKFLSQTIEVLADGSEIEPIQLAPAPKYLRITSDPPGAKIILNGTRLDEVTPTDHLMTKRDVSRDKTRIQLRLRGHKTVFSTTVMTDAYQREDDKLIFTIDNTLAVRVAPKYTPNVAPKPVSTPARDTQPDTDNDAEGTENGAEDSIEDEAADEAGEDAPPAASPVPTTETKDVDSPQDDDSEADDDPDDNDNGQTVQDEAPPEAPKPDWME